MQISVQRGRQFSPFGLLLLILSFVPIVCAQYTTASLSGTVTDQSGASVAGAKVTILNLGTGFQKSLLTEERGVYLFPLVPIGNYRITVEHPGFMAYVREGVTLTVNQQATADVGLQLGSVASKVAVSANAELVDLRSTSTGQLIGEKQILELPLNGRSPQTLMFLAAGTTDFSRNAPALRNVPFYVTPDVNGAGWAGVNYQMDGAGNDDTQQNQNLPFPNPDAVQEFNLVSGNFSAEFGNGAGGVVNVVTKSGTNTIHGSLFEFVRNGAFNARNYFAASPDALKRNQFGGSVGGPILKNRLFYFGSYQGTLLRTTPAGLISFVPTAQERTGNFSDQPRPITDPTTNQPFAGNLIPASRLSPVASYLLGHIPLPNGPALGQLTYLGTEDIQNLHEILGKFDYVSTKHQINGHFFRYPWDKVPVIQSENLLALASNSMLNRIDSGAVNYTYTHSPTLLLNTNFGFTKFYGGPRTTAPFNLADAGVNIATPSVRELSVSVPNMSIGTNNSGNLNRSDITIRENLTWVKGRHELRFGGEVVRLWYSINSPAGMNGGFSFSGQFTGLGLADFMTGNAAAFTQGGGQFEYLTGGRYGFYFQDNWRVSKRLTLNLGLRWDPFLPPYDQAGRVMCFEPGVQSSRYTNAPAGLVYSGAPGCPTRGAENNLANLAPRLGFAYRLTEDGKTALRVGVGTYYTPPATTWNSGLATSPPFSPSFTLNAVNFSDPWGSAKIPNPFPAQYGPALPSANAAFTLPATFTYLQKDFHVPTLYSGNVALEHQLRDLLLRAAYVGNRGVHQFQLFRGMRDANAAVYIPGQSTLANTQARRPYPSFGAISAIESANNSNYNSLQLVADKRFNSRYSILVNYTWSKELSDIVEQCCAWTNPFSRRFDYGPSNTDVRHTFRFTNMLAIPNLPVQGIPGKVINGWMLNSIVTWQSGMPFNPLSGVDNAFDGGSNQRADFLGGDPNLSSGRSHAAQIQQWFNTALFTKNAPGTFGNTGKDVLIGPRLFNTDANLSKNFALTERMRFQFRAEFFNLFNNTNFTLPGTSVSAPATFGKITGALSPRVMQLALKFYF